MSMDLSVWSARTFDLNSDLPNSKEWRQYPMSWAHEADGWQVVLVVSNDTRDDRPDCVGALDPNAKHVTYVTLEPIGAVEVGYAYLERTVRHLAGVSNGVWVDGLGTHAYRADDGSF